MPDGRRHSQPDRLWIKFLGSSGTSDTAAVFAAGMGGDCRCLCRRAIGEKFQDALGKSGDVALVRVSIAEAPAFTLALPSLRILKTFGFGAFQCFGLDQHALALVTPPRTAELHDHRFKP